MDIPSKIDFDLSKIPSYISLTLGGWDGVLRTPDVCGAVHIPSFQPMVFGQAPTFPPIIFGQTTPKFPIISGPCRPPDMIKVEVPKIPDIKIDWGKPLEIKCVCVIRSPGDTYQQYLDAREKAGIHITTEEKCRAIVENTADVSPEGFEEFVNNVYDSIKNKTAAVEQ